jgi:hypothetical protein
MYDMIVLMRSEYILFDDLSLLYLNGINIFTSASEMIINLMNLKL